MKEGSYRLLEQKGIEKMKQEQRIRMRMQLFAMLVVLCMAVMTGCGKKADKNGSMTSDDGRSYGGTIKGNMGEKVSTAFFDLTVEQAEKYQTYQFDDGLYQADDGNTYLVLKVTIQNTYEKDLPMSITDFVLKDSESESTDLITGHGNTDLKKDDFMDNLFTLKKGESITKYILYTVKDADAYTLQYTEYYEDKFEGDVYQITFKPEQK